MMHSFLHKFDLIDNPILLAHFVCFRLIEVRILALTAAKLSSERALGLVSTLVDVLMIRNELSTSAKVFKIKPCPLINYLV